MKERFNKLFLIFYVWTVGLILGILFCIFRILGRVKVEGYRLDKLIPPKEGLIVIYNHPSLLEPSLLPFLFFPWYLFFPRMIPFSTLDKKNYYDKWWFLPFRPVSIPIVREEQGRYNSLKQLLQNIKRRRIIIFSPEGGRTFKGKEFKTIKNEEIVIKDDWEKVKNNSAKIRRFQPEISTLLKRVQVILPIWTEGGEKVIPNEFSFPRGFYFPFPKLWKKIRIKIGEPVKNIQNLEDLEDNLLKCGAV